MSDLEYDLEDGIQLIRRGVSQEDRLNALGLSRIIDLLAEGNPLLSRKDAVTPGILNLLHVTEHAFMKWFLKQSASDQDSFNNVIEIQKGRMKEDLLVRGIETLDQFDQLVDDLKEKRTTPMIAAQVAGVLDKKQKTSSSILKNITDLQKLEKGTNQKHQGQTTAVEIHVHTDSQQLERARKLKALRDSREE